MSKSQDSIPPVEAQSVAKQDQVSPVATIYDASLSSVFWRNFLAGVARGLGGILINVIFLLFISLVVMNWLLPRVQPLFDTYQKAINSLDGIGQTTQRFTLPN